MDRRFCAVDVEGDAGERGIIGAAIYSDVMREWLTDPVAILAALTKHAQEGYTFVCHNADYDISVLWHQLGQDVSIHRYNGGFYCGYWRHKRGRAAAHIWDSCCLAGGNGLAELGSALGLPKLPTPRGVGGVDLDRYRWRCDAHGRWECIECYAIRDAAIVFTYCGGLAALCRGWGIEITPTLAGIAERAWTALDQPTAVTPLSRKSQALAREAYVGGRVECYQLGHMGPIWTADIRSAYLSTMATTPYPDPRDLHYWTAVPIDRIPTQGEGVLQGSVSVPPMSVPPLPYRRGPERMYPVGHLEGTWTLHELRYAQSVGVRVLRCDALCWSPTLVYPFPQFSSIMLAGRADAEANHSPMAAVYKLLGNALYGRLGMSGSIERTITRPQTPKMTLGQMVGNTWRRQGDRYIWSQRDDLAIGQHHGNVMWAAQTTAALRVRMHPLLLAQGESLAYTDTDCIFSTAPIEGVSDGAGNLEPEGVYERAIISGPKEYALQNYASDMPDEWADARCSLHSRPHCDECRWRARAKGVPRNVALSYLRTGAVEFSRPITTAQSARSGIKAGTWIRVTRERQHAPYRRHPTDAAALLSYEGASPTQPPVIP